MNPAGSVTYNVTINTSGLAGQISNVNSQLGNAGASGASAFAAQFAIVSTLISTGLNAAINLISSSVSDAVARFDTLNNAPKVLENLGFSAQDSSAAIKTLAAGVTGLPTSLSDAATALERIAGATGDSASKATDLTLAFNNMALASGNGPGAASSALTQFTQALGRGKVQIGDWNILSSIMPAQLTQIAHTMLGASGTSTQLGSDLADGTISMSAFSDQIIALNAKGGPGFASFATQAKDATGGVGTGITNMKLAVVKGIADILAAIGSANITNTLKDIGSAFQSSLKDIADVINFVEAHKGVFGTLAVGITAAVTAIILYNAYVVISTAVTTAYSLATIFLVSMQAAQAGGMGILSAAWAALNVVMDANPIGIVIVAVVALTAALIYFFTQTALGKQIVQDVTNFITTQWNQVTKEFVDSWNNIVTVWNAVSGFFSNIWNDIVNIFSGVSNWFNNTFSQAWNDIKGIFGAVGSWFSNNVVNPIVNAFSGIGSRIASFFSGLWDSVGADLKSIINSVLHLPLIIPKISVGGVSVGGQTLIPRLATGGIVDSPTTALIGEAGPEAVIPLSQNSQWMNELASKINGSNAQTIIVQIGNDTVARKVVDVINDRSRISGQNMIKV